ncbi:MAG TPA: hypothetical protein IAA06_13430, partial [Candidatus Blautia faecavium]|nr:hypothetical protein [Candidatus Blautia faecavium]
AEKFKDSLLKYKISCRGASKAPPSLLALNRKTFLHLLVPQGHDLYSRAMIPLTFKLVSYSSYAKTSDPPFFHK